MTTLPDISQPGGQFEHFVGELDWIIENAIVNQPRSLQRRVGPSEIGNPCARRLGYKMAGVEPVNTGRLPYKPFIGTAVHAALHEIFMSANRALGEDAGPRFLLEHKVGVGEINGEDISGSCDLYDRVTCTVVDWKVVGADSLRKYKAGGPGEEYRVQAHTYGRGWQLRGYHVESVAVYFLPRDREWDKRYAWHEPYDETVATKALERADGIAKLIDGLGTAALPMLPTAEAWCRYCPHFMPASTELHEACPGHRPADEPSTT